MAQIESINPNIDTDSIYIYDNADGEFVGDNHLQIVVCDSDTINTIKIWVERLEGNNEDIPADEDGAREYQLDSDVNDDASFTIYLDDNEILSSFIKTTSTVEVSLDKDTHILTFKADSVRFYSLWKYGKYSQPNETTAVLADHSESWLENRVVLDATIYAESDSNWIVLNNPNGTMITILENADNDDREGIVSLYIKYDESIEPRKIAEILIKQVHAKDVLLYIQEIGDEENSKQLLPLIFNYSTYFNSNTYWDTLTALNTWSKVLNFNRLLEIDSASIYVIGDSVMSAESELGASTNIFGYKWFDLLLDDNKNIDVIDNSDDFKDIEVLIVAHGKKHVFHPIKGYDETTTEIIYYDEVPYFQVDDYSSCYMMGKTCFGSVSDYNYWAGDDELITELKTVIEDKLKDKLKADDNFAAVPLAHEDTKTSYFFDFKLNSLQSADGIYSISSNGYEIDNTQNQNGIIECDIRVFPGDEESKILEKEIIDTPESFGLSEFYKIKNGFDSTFNITADFTSSNRGATKGFISYTPFIVNYSHTATYKDEYDRNILTKTTVVNEHNKDSFYDIYEYVINTEFSTDISGITINNALKNDHYYSGNTWTKDAHVAETASIKYYVKTIETAKTHNRELFNLNLKCVLKDKDTGEIFDSDVLPHDVRWDGYIDNDKPTYIFIGTANSEYLELPWRYSNNGNWEENVDTKGTRFLYGYYYPLLSLENGFKGCLYRTFEFELFRTTPCVNMASMFQDSPLLVELDLHILDTSNVQNMSHMFDSCIVLPYLDLHTFDTSKVQDMSYMFLNCGELEALNICTFDTANVTTMEGMFDGCKKLRIFTLTNKDNGVMLTPNDVWEAEGTYEPDETQGDIVYDLNGDKNMPIQIFNSTENTNTIILRPRVYPDELETDKIATRTPIYKDSENKGPIDAYVYKPTTYSLTNFDTSKVTNMARMFYNCSSIAVFNLNGFDTANVTTMESMFYGCSSVDTLSLASFNTSRVTNYSNMFNGCSNLTCLNLKNFSVPTNAANMFSGCNKLEYICCSEAFKTWALGNAGAIGLPASMISGTWETD